MTNIKCPYCLGGPSTPLSRFLPGLNLVREAFVCDLCSRTSYFSGNSRAWSVAVGIASIAIPLLVLRGVMVAMGVSRIPGLFAAVTLLVAIAVLYQVPAGLTLRYKATLVPGAREVS